jgi:hypothetical protein
MVPIPRHILASLGIMRGLVDNARRAATPHAVECAGLTREHLGSEGFQNAFGERVQWCEEHCRSDFTSDPIRDGYRLTGRCFRFADQGEAMHFKLRFD